MSDKQPSIAIVGAGSVGVNTAYDLARAGAEITFLVRPHRQQQLSRPQALYSYDDNTLDHFSDYSVITDPASLADQEFDFVVVTLDNASLRAEAGRTLVQAVGHAFRGTTTGVILNAIGIEVRSWFLAESGLSPEQVAMANTGGLIHEVAAANLSVDPSVDADLLAQADYAFVHPYPAGFTIADNAPQLAEAFTAIYSGSGIPAAETASAAALSLGVAGMAPTLTWGLLDWRPLEEVDSTDATWQLGVESMREIQRLSIFGPEGSAATERTTPEGELEHYRRMERLSKPLNLGAFFAYHHGGKVNKQDLDFIDDALQRGEAAGQDVPALRELSRRLHQA